MFHGRTQSIVSVSEHAGGGGKESVIAAAAAVKEERAAAAVASASKSIKTRRRKKVSSLNVSEAGKAKRDPQVLYSSFFKLRKIRKGN